MEQTYLTPINVPVPPPHTQIHPRCFTCKKFPVCSLRDDYLKTATLIQWVLGDPQKDREIGWIDYRCGELHDFKGFNFHNPGEIFPETVTTKNNEVGSYLDSKWRNYNIVQFIYIINDYYVQFDAFWNCGLKTYEIKGHEVYYNIPYSLSTESESAIIEGLTSWREKMIEKEKENKNYDIVNTTHFSAILNCVFYEQQKGLSEREGIERLFIHYPNGFPYHHLATYHIEPYKVPTFAPFPYPHLPCGKKPE